MSSIILLTSPCIFLCTNVRFLRWKYITDTMVWTLSWLLFILTSMTILSFKFRQKSGRSLRCKFCSNGVLSNFVVKLKANTKPRGTESHISFLKTVRSYSFKYFVTIYDDYRQTEDRHRTISAELLRLKKVTKHLKQKRICIFAHHVGVGAAWTRLLENGSVQSLKSPKQSRIAGWSVGDKINGC